jgi:hypothetical protein
MKEAIILDELKNMIDSKGTDFESLRNAVETRKLVKELEGIRLSRYLAVLSVIISFSLLFWQGFQSLDAATRELKKDHIDTLNSKIEGKTEEISRGFK